MKICNALIVAGAVVGLMPSVPTLAETQSKAALIIPENGGVYIDAKSFKIEPGSAKEGASAMMKQLGARELGPAAVIFRNGNKLYVTTDAYGGTRRYGDEHEDRYQANARRYGEEHVDRPNTSDRRFGEEHVDRPNASDRRYGEEHVDRPNASDRRYGDEHVDRYSADRRYGDEHDDRYSSRYAKASAPGNPYVNDPEYTQYRMRKLFDENWTTSDTK